MFRVRIRLTGATQFVDTSPVVSFKEYLDADKLPLGVHPVVYGFAFRFQGTAPVVSLTLRPQSGSPAVDEQLIVYAPAEAKASYSKLCGKDGVFVVPRRYGYEAAAQPPTGGSKAVGGEAYGLYFTTTSKDNAGTFECWYGFDRVGSTP